MQFLIIIYCYKYITFWFPWAISLVLTTSNGNEMTVAADPDTAPDKKFIVVDFANPGFIWSACSLRASKTAN